jgi:Fe-S-cluster containining protein
LTEPSISEIVPYLRILLQESKYFKTRGEQLSAMNDPAIGTASVLHGTIQVQTDRFEYSTSFSSGLRFRCLPECGLCCRSYRIPLTSYDLDRLQEVVEPEACPNIAYVDSGQEGGISAFMENRKAEGCCYLDTSARCSVYRSRPLYCRTYPLIRDTYEQLEMSVDHTCPGVGEGEPVKIEQIEEAFLLEAQNQPDVLKVRESGANYRVICGSLKAMGVYADAGLIRSVCKELIRRALTSSRGAEISAYLRAAAAALAELPAGAGSIMDPEAAAHIVEGVENTLGSGATQTEEGELCHDAAESLGEYLAEWIRRQALLRFVHATALASPGRENVLHSFFAFLVHGACSILTDAQGLSGRAGEQRITARLMQEAIRSNEGPLRSRCASVVSTK